LKILADSRIGQGRPEKLEKSFTVFRLHEQQNDHELHETKKIIHQRKQMVRRDIPMEANAKFRLALSLLIQRSKGFLQTTHHVSRNENERSI